MRGCDLAGAAGAGRCRRRARRGGARGRRAAPRAPLIASAIGSGRWIQSASGPSTRLPSTRTGWPGLPTTVAPGGTSSTTTVLAPTLAPSPTVDRPQQLGAGADGDVVPECRVALAALEAGAAQRHPLVEGDAVADHGGLADHHAGAVVDEELPADHRRRVDLDPGHRAGQVGDRARQHRHAGLHQRVRGAVGQQRLHAGPAAEDLEGGDALGGGVAVARRGDVGAHLARPPASTGSW